MNQAELVARWNTAIREVIAWAPNAKLEKANGTQFHHVLQALNDDDLVRAPQATEADHRHWYRESLDHTFNVFVIEHDWAAAFDGADEGRPKEETIGPDEKYRSGGMVVTRQDQDYRLPFNECCFEFQMSGRRLCILIRWDGELYVWTAVIKTSVGWVYFALNESEHRHIREKLRAVVRGAAIALDAEIAKRDVVRVPHKLNAARERRGKTLIANYHIVSLARRSRVERLPDANGEPTRKVRLHFRRGHWRHFENSKTWIKWTLVGDPDLGFIEKHYRL